MEFLNFVLPVLLYIFGIILLIVLIIQILERIDHLVDDIEHKINSLNGLFTIIDRTTDGLALITDRFVGAATNAISKIFKKGKKEDDINE